MFCLFLASWDISLLRSYDHPPAASINIRLLRSQGPPSRLTRQPSLPADQPSLPANQPGLPADQPGLPADQPSLPANQPGLLADQPSLPADQPSLLADQPSLPADPPNRRFGQKLLQKRALHKQSAKPTTDNSPALQCWEQGANTSLQSVKRTAELSKNFSRPLCGLVRSMRPNPSTEVLGYCQSSRFTGLYSDLLCKPAKRWTGDSESLSPAFAG